MGTIPESQFPSFHKIKPLLETRAEIHAEGSSHGAGDFDCLPQAEIDDLLELGVIEKTDFGSYRVTDGEHHFKMIQGPGA